MVFALRRQQASRPEKKKHGGARSWSSSTMSTGDWEYSMPRELVICENDDVSSIHVGESVVEGRPDYPHVEPNHTVLKDSKEELNMLFSVPEELDVIEMSRSVSPRKQAHQVFPATTPKSKVSGVPSQKSKSLESKTTVQASNSSNNSRIKISAFVHLSLMVDKTRNISDRNRQIVQDTLRFHIDRMCDLETFSGKSQPVNVDDVSFINESSMEQVVSNVMLCLKEEEYDEAADVYRGLLKTQRKTANSDKIMGETLAGLVMLYLLSGGEALKCAEESLQLAQKASEKKRIAMGLSLVGTCHFYSSSLKKALDKWKEALHLFCLVLGYDHDHVALLLNNIACAYYQLNDLEKARVYFRESLHLLKRHSKDSCALLQIAATQSNLALVCVRQDQPQSAISLLEEAQLVQESAMVYGNREVEMTKDTLRHLMYNYSLRTNDRIKHASSGRDAKSVFGDCNGIPLRTASASPSNYIVLGSLAHESTATERVHHAVLADVVRTDDAGSRASIPVDVDGNDVVDAELHLTEIYNQATTHLKNDEVEEATELLEIVLKNHIEKYGEAHHLVGAAHHNLGIVAMFAQEYDAASRKFNEAINVRTATLGPNHPDVLASMERLAMVQMAQQDLDGAHITFSQILQTQRRMYGYNHVNVAKTLNQIGCLHYEFGGLLASLKAFEEGLEILQSQQGRHRRHDFALIKSNIGFVFFKQADYKRFIAALEEALDTIPHSSSHYAFSEVLIQNLAQAMVNGHASAVRDRAEAIQQLTGKCVSIVHCGPNERHCG